MSPRTSSLRERSQTEGQNNSKLRLQLIVLGFFRFSEALAWTSIFPYAPVMVQSFGPGSEAHAALVVGLLISAFTFCEFLGGTVWARISDHIGRKPTLLIGAVGAMASALFFGFSESIFVAVGVRALGGLTNPNVGVTQTCVAELVKKKDHQAKAFSIVPFLRSFGSVCGPVLGGLLSEPVKRYPKTFHPDSIWASYPFLLPNLAVALSIAATTLTGFFFLEETHPKYSGRWDSKALCIDHIIPLFSLSALRKRLSRYSVIGDQDDSEDSWQERDDTEAKPDDDQHELEALHPSTEDSNIQDDTQPPPLSRRQIFTNQVLLQILSVSLLAFHKVASDTLIPVFLANPPSPSHPLRLAERSFLNVSGGFGMSPSRLGEVFLSQAIVAFISQFICVPYIIKRYGALQVYRWTLFIFPWMYLLTPFVVKLPKPLSTIALLADLWIKVVLVALGYVCSAILITNTMPSKQYLATVNGAAASLSCLARSIGPVTAGPLFDWSTKRDLIGLPFWILSAVSAIGALEAWVLRDYP